MLARNSSVIQLARTGTVGFGQGGGQRGFLARRDGLIQSTVLPRGRSARSRAIAVVPSIRWYSVSRSASSPPLACRSQTRSPMREPVGRRAEHRRLHLAGALDLGQPQPGGPERRRQPVRCPGARGDVAAAEQGGHPAARAGAPPAARTCRAGRGWNLRYASNSVGPTRPEPGGQLGDRLVGRGGFERAGAAAVDELERGQRADPCGRPRRAARAVPPPSGPASPGPGAARTGWPGGASPRPAICPS